MRALGIKTKSELEDRIRSHKTKIFLESGLDTLIHITEKLKSLENKNNE